MMISLSTRHVLLLVGLLWQLPIVDSLVELSIIDRPSGPEYESLPLCQQTSAQLVSVNSTTVVAPCVLYDTQPPNTNTNTTTNSSTTSHVLTVVGVFPSSCGQHRDGALMAVEAINQNGGAAIGYNSSGHSLSFRLVVAIAGNHNQLSPTDYAAAHTLLLESMVMSLQPQYILGTCSFVATLDKAIAARHQTMVLSQVGPHSFYAPGNSNDYVFGAHIPSETYGLPALQALRFATPNKRQQKIRILHRDRSEFFYSTCQEIYHRALQDGFTDTRAIQYNPNDDHDQNGILNREDVPFLQSMADEACSSNYNDNEQVAIWLCVESDIETNTILDRWKENNCRPSSLWMTTASWAYADRFPQAVQYTQSGAQWHKAMTYSDEYYPNGQAMLDAASQRLGYTPGYGALGAYHAIYVMYQNTRIFVRTKDNPDIAELYQTQYEEMRRHLLGVSIPRSLYGPTVFDVQQRNIGRGSAGMQWGFLPSSSGSSSNNDPSNATTASNDNSPMELLLVSPFDQAEATVVVPAPTARDCPNGQFVNQSAIETGDSLLESKCSACPADTYRTEQMAPLECRACPGGSSTQGQSGADICIRQEDNLISEGLLIFGYCIMGCVFVCAVGFASWTFYHRDDPVVKLSQMEFLLLLCLGSALSSSTIIPLSIQAGSEGDTEAASRACITLPWLVSTGWILQYTSLLAKSYRLYRLTNSSRAFRRATVSILETFKIVAAALLINWAALLAWTLTDPMSWERVDIGTTIDRPNGVITLETIGHCDSDNMGAWLGSLFAFHITVMIATNIILWKLRAVSDRYQESKYITLASIFACEFLLLGLPILLAVDDSAAAQHIVLICIVGFTDLGILLMLFLPKIYFQRKGLAPGVSVPESFMKYRKSTVAGGTSSALRFSQQRQCPPSTDPNVSSTHPSEQINGQGEEERKLQTVSEISAHTVAKF